MAEIWELNNKSTFTTPEEVENVQNAIKMLLIELEREKNLVPQATKRIEALEKDIQYQKAWIGPVIRLNTDILYEIFVASSAMDWKAPVSLGSVCRFWRETILQFPRVWSFIETGRTNTMGSEDLERWLQRCGKVELHMRIDPGSQPEYVEKLLDYASQATCLYNARDLSLNVRAFSHLEQLIVQLDAYGTIHFNQLLNSISQYPNLRNLHFHHILDAVITSSIQPLVDFPPLQNLHMSSAIPQWNTILRLCASSLESLGLAVYWDTDIDPVRSQAMSIHLSNLRHLSFAYAEDTVLSLITPKLESYHVDHRDTTSPLHLDVGTVVDLIYAGRYAPDLSQYPTLETAHMQLDDDDRLEVLRALTAFPTLCPSLKLLSFLQGPSSTSFYDQEMELIEARKNAGLKPLTIGEFTELEQVGFKYWNVRT